MAKHFTPKQRKVRKAMIAGAATAGLSGAIAIVQGTSVVDALVELSATDTVLGLGGSSNPSGDRIPPKLSGSLVPDQTKYHGIEYPATLDLAGSRDVGVPLLHDAITKPPAQGGYAGDNLTVIGYSEGALVVEQERRDLQAMDPGEAPSPDELKFTQIGSPFIGNGGVFARFPQTPTFLIIDNMGPAQETRYDTTYITNEYDPYGDFPAYANPFSLANTVLAVRYAHPDEAYDPINPGTTPLLGDEPRIVQNDAGGTDTYYLYRNDNLPLVAPIREVADLANIRPLVEPGVGLVEPTLRVLVDAGYTDRENAHPETPTQFSLITPPAKIIEAGAALPGAAQAGLGNFLGGTQAISPLDAPTAKASNTPAITALPINPVLPDVLPKPSTSAEPPKILQLPALPKLDAEPRVPSNRRSLPNLGTLVGSHTTAAPKSPSFGGNRPAGALSGALKNVGAGLLGKKPTTADSE